MYFIRDLPDMLIYDNWSAIEVKWRKLIEEMNEKLWKYGETKGEQLGTTLTVLLLFHHRYMIAQVGDSRAYVMGRDIIQITEDQSLVAREVKKGKITRKQAARDPRRNVLLECIGVSRSVNPDFFYGEAERGDSFLLCTDGFWRVRTQEELMQEFQVNFRNEQEIKGMLGQMVSENIERGEKDNITVVYVQPEEEG